MTSNAKRGRYWEDVLERSIDKIGDHCGIVATSPDVQVVRRPRNAKGAEFIGFFKKKGQVDFEGGYRDTHAGFDAKRCKGPRFPFKSIKQHQVDRLTSDLLNHRMSGIFLMIDMENGDRRYYGIAWRTIWAAMNNWKKSVSNMDLFIMAKMPKQTGVFLLRETLIGANTAVEVHQFLEWMYAKGRF